MRMPACPDRCGPRNIQGTRINRLFNSSVFLAEKMPDARDWHRQTMSNRSSTALVHLHRRFGYPWISSTIVAPARVVCVSYLDTIQENSSNETEAKQFI